MTHRILAIIALLGIITTAAWAENSWEVTFEGVTDNEATFKVKRTGDTSIAETVNYRTVSLSAYAGKHFTATYGQLNFGAGDDYKTVSVTELSPNDVFQYHKAGIANLSYRLEVTDVGGFHLAHYDRSKSWGSTINSSNAFAVKDVSVNSGEITVKDENYSQAYHAVTVSSYFSAAAPKAYLTSAGAELRMTLSLQAKEKDDGYQHLQILVNQTSNHDEGAGDNNPGTMSYSSYMATFCHKGGSTNTTYSNYVFPDVSHGTNCGNVGLAWSSINSSNDVGELRQQYFQSNCRADDGRLIIASKSALSSFSTLGIRFDASGNNEDTWYAYNTVAHIQAVDVTAPTVSQVTVCPGIHAKGNPIYVSIAFNEIVTISGSTKMLTTNWGNLNYIAGDGTNVLTFGGDISSSASGQLQITGKDGTISDLAGKTCSSVNRTIGTSLDASHAYTIAYDLAGGTLETANPTTYNYETPSFTLANPTRTGYTFAGWTGSNGNTPQTTVTIAQGSHGDKSYTAQWTNPSGTCGNSATWLYDHPTRTLTIGGSGEIDNYTVNYAPWQDYKPYITNLNIGDGITEIGSDAFRDCAALTTITGGGGIIDVTPAAFTNTPWYDAARASTDVVYLGQTAFCGVGVSGAVSIQDGTIRICKDAFSNNDNITTVTIPATVTDIEMTAFYRCSSLTTVNVLAATPPVLYDNVFAYLHALARTYNVRNADYKTADVWADIYNKAGDHAGNIYSNCTMRVISTLTLPDDVTATADAADIVTDGGTDYYAEGTTVTVAFPATVLVGGVTYANSVLLNGSANGVTTNGSGSATFTMPDADATVSLQRTPVSVAYIDENGEEKICTDFVLLESNDGFTPLGTDGQTNWYVASGDVTFGGQLCFKNSHSHLILCDGATLTATCSNDYAIYGQKGGITIYGQTEGSGTISANATGTGGYNTGIQASGDFTINGGHVSASGGGRHGIYCGGCFTINGGSVSATGGGGRGISCGGDFTINGGSVSATSSNSNSNGIYSGGNIVLGWSNISDRITASSYGIGNGGGTVSVKAGRPLRYGTTPLIGDITASIADLAGQTLEPAVPYIDENGQEQICTDFVLLESSNLNFTNLGADNETHWYVASGNVTFGGQLCFRNSHSHLILCDGATLTATKYLNYAIYGQHGGITIYGQTEGSGTLSANATGTGGYITGIQASGAITINGGHVSANGRFGIECSNFTINGGSVSATGGGGEGISCGGDFTINGGSVNATSNNSNGIYSDGNIVLGWSNISDRITASSYGLGNGGGTVSVKADQTLYDGTTALTSDITASIAGLAGKTLEPGIPFDIDGTVILLDDDRMQPDGYKNADRIAAFQDESHNVMLYGRTLYKDGSWNSLCLPFYIGVISEDCPLNSSVTAGFISGTFFEDGEFRTGMVDNGKLYIGFDVNDIYSPYSPGEPMLVKWDKPDGYDSNPTKYDIVNPVFFGVAFTKENSLKISSEEGPDNVSICGTYSPIDYNADNHSILFLGADNCLYWAKAGAHIGAFRAYFELGNGLTVGEPSSLIRGFSLGFGDSETGIDIPATTPTARESGDWYDLQGRKLNGMPTQKGVYIKDGKKIRR
ncbi:MAG: leucine-rich repeat protein [Bacteroidaceae bacterium]|nr:leucine-rich repeat protein [Bacteroidaceae bacterium]